MVKDPRAYCMSWLFYTEFYLFASNSPALENSIWKYSSHFFKVSSYENIFKTNTQEKVIF